jgi:uncharacterized protein YegL
MTGEPIEQVKNGVQMLVSSLRKDPYALETAFLSVITFDSTANQVVPLTELVTFQVPDLNANGVTAMGEALSLAKQKADQEVTKSSAEVKGDWKPMVFIMTDGLPTDDLQKGLKEFRQGNWGIVVGCGVDDADTDALKQIAGESVVTLSTSDSNSMSAFFKWVSASISFGSKSVETVGKDVSGLDELPPPPPEINIVV